MQLQKATVIEKMRIVDNIHQLTAVKADNITPVLSSCWPPDDGHCSPCTIYDTDVDVGFFVWGEYAGDPNRKSVYAQQSCVDVSNLKRLVCKVARAKSTAVPEGDGLYIGIVDAETLNDVTKLFNPSGWAWAGYLSTLPGGVPIQHYYMCVDINQTFDTTKWWYLVMVTDGSYEICGWQMGGFGKAGYPEEVQRLSRFFYNEPGHEDGWAIQDNWFRGCVVYYTEGAGPIYEGYSSISEPNFPPTADVGVAYNFDFLINQLTAFPCGCPETVVWQIYNLDTNEPIHDPVTHLLVCGYTGVTFSGSLTFSGDGGVMFHGRLYAGHKINGEWTADTYYDFDVWVNCTEGSWGCDANGDKWVCTGGAWVKQTPSPHPDCYTSCEQIPTKTECETAGCLWWNQACHSVNPTTCDELNNETDCKSWGCAWWNNSCHGYVPSTCEELNNQTDCEFYKCYWYDNSCHSSPQQPEICDWIDSKGGPTGLTVPDVYTILDSYSSKIPPPGYTFVPTVMNVYGVLDYYLGYDADAATGCDYY